MGDLAQLKKFQIQNIKNSGTFKLLGQGLFEFENSNFMAALAAFNSVLKSSPGDHDAMFYKAKTLVKLDKAYEAIQIYKNLTELTKQHSHFSHKWSLPSRDDVSSLFYAQYNDW